MAIHGGTTSIAREVISLLTRQRTFATISRASQQLSHRMIPMEAILLNVLMATSARAAASPDRARIMEAITVHSTRIDCLYPSLVTLFRHERARRCRFSALMV